MPEEQRTSVDIKSFIQEVADNAGFDGMKAVELAERLIKEKCYDIAAPMPYGGATSFGDIDTNMAGMEYAAKVSETTYQLQGIIGNITSDQNLDVEEKASKMAAAVDDYKNRITEIRANQGSKENILTRWFGGKRNYSKDERDAMAKSGQALSDGSYPIKDATDLSNAIRAIGRASSPGAAKAHIIKRARALGKTDMLPEGWKEANLTRDLPSASGFKVYVDDNGDYRWLSLSSNAFEDLDKELFTTEALQEAIDYADKEGQRGPLLVYHVPSAEIGQCDYQAMAGRFLVESGTFNDTPLGRKALEYFVNSEEEHQVSIGFQYRVGDEVDGQFDWLRIKERSTTPYGAAANPWTDFKLIVGDSKVNEQKAAHLRKMFGDDLANEVIAGAEAKTKELEQSVRFKETKPVEYDEKEFGEITDVEEIAEEKAVAEPLAHVHGNVKHTHRVLPETEHQHQGGPAFKAAKKPDPDAADEDTEDAHGNMKKMPPGMMKKDSDEKSTELAQTLASLLEDVSVIRDTVTALDGEVKALKQEATDSKERENNRPRYSPTGGRPSESEGNVIGSKDLESILQQGEQKPENNPAFAYVQDLLSANGASSSN